MQHCNTKHQKCNKSSFKFKTIKVSTPRVKLLKIFSINLICIHNFRHLIKVFSNNNTIYLNSLSIFHKPPLTFPSLTIKLLRDGMRKKQRKKSFCKIFPLNFCFVQTPKQFRDFIGARVIYLNYQTSKFTTKLYRNQLIHQ